MMSLIDRNRAQALADAARDLLHRAQPIRGRTDGLELAYTLSACNLLALAARELSTAAQDPNERHPKTTAEQATPQES